MQIQLTSKKQISAIKPLYQATMPLVRQINTNVAADVGIEPCLYAIKVPNVLRYKIKRTTKFFKISDYNKNCTFTQGNAIQTIDPNYPAILLVLESPHLYEFFKKI